MTKSDILYKLSIKSGLSEKRCEEIIDLFAEEVKNCLIDGDKVVLKNFMTFEITQRPKRQGRNPQTGEVTIYPPVKSVKCKVSKSFKDAINGKRDQTE